MYQTQLDRAEELNLKALSLIRELKTLEPWQLTKRLSMLGEIESSLTEAIALANDI